MNFHIILIIISYLGILVWHSRWFDDLRSSLALLSLHLGFIVLEIISAMEQQMNLILFLAHHDSIFLNNQTLSSDHLLIIL